MRVRPRLRRFVPHSGWQRAGPRPHSGSWGRPAESRPVSRRGTLARLPPAGLDRGGATSPATGACVDRGVRCPRWLPCRGTQEARRRNSPGRPTWRTEGTLTESNAVPVLRLSHIHVPHAERVRLALQERSLALQETSLDSGQTRPRSDDEAARLTCTARVNEAANPDGRSVDTSQPTS
jgi:hypothetical protein